MFIGVIPLDNATGRHNPSSPHDKRHKELFSNKKSFLSLLRDCVKEPWVNDIDEGSITKTNDSFILQDFSEKEADIVYEAKINGSTVVFTFKLQILLLKAW